MSALLTARTKGPRKSEFVYQQIRQEIIDGTYKPGGEISVNELAEKYGVSRQPVMDAIRRLEEADFLTVVPQVGVFLVVPTASDAEDFYRVWSATEGMVAGMAADRHDQTDLLNLTSAVNRLSEGLSDTSVANMANYINLNREIHHRIYQMAGSPTVLRLALNAWDRSDFLIVMSGVDLDLERMRTADEEHRQILEAITRRDVADARRIMESHVLETGAKVVAAMRTLA